MSRRAYELYGVERDEDLRLVKVPLGYSTELVGYTARPGQEKTIEVLPASGRLREWLVAHNHAAEHDDIRFLVFSDRNLEYYNPLDAQQAGLLVRLAHLDFSEDEGVVAFVRSYGSPSAGRVYPRLDRPAEGVTVGAVGDEVDFAPADYHHRGQRYDRGSFIGWWELEREAAQLRTILELLKAITEGDGGAAKHLIGPLADLQGLPYRGHRVGGHLYERYSACWLRAGANREPCSLTRQCPRPDSRSGWYLSYPIPFFVFGPCARRLPVLPEEYLIAARHAVALSFTRFPRSLLNGEVNVEPLIEADLRSAALSEFREDFYLSLLPEDVKPRPDSLKELPWHSQPALLEMVRDAGPRSPGGQMARRPLFVFHRVVRGALSAAWYQLLDLVVQYSELRRCKHCGALFGATHGNQDYCPSPRKGLPSACQQAAKQARKRAARKAKPEAKPVPRRTSRRTPRKPKAT